MSRDRPSEAGTGDADDDALVLIKAFDAAGKPIAAICHAPWLSVEAGIAMGR